MFFVFEGVDGAGKSTQLEHLVRWLQRQGHDVVVGQDPGSTGLGTRLRELLLGNHDLPISMVAEMMLFTTARAQLVEELVRPALAAGKTVVLDRYVFSTVVYQGYAGNLDPEDIRRVNQIATGGLLPDLTLILDIPVAAAVQRLGEALDRMESRGEDYLNRVREGFQLEAERWPQGVERIGANRAADEIAADIQQYASDAIARKKGIS